MNASRADSKLMVTKNEINLILIHGNWSTKSQVSLHSDSHIAQSHVTQGWNDRPQNACIKVGTF